jgi:transmembrane sensor
MGRNVEETAARWLIRRENEQWSPQDQLELDRWLQSSPQHREVYVRLESAWREADELKNLSAVISDDSRTPTETKEADIPGESSDIGSGDRAPGATVKRTVFAVGGLILLATGALGYRPGYFNGGSGHGVPYTAGGQFSVIRLQDDSIVTLNSQTSIDVRITAQERRIRLIRGEAFFKVGQDPTRPFTVETDQRQIVALGTQFDVRLEAAGSLHVAVTEGRVLLEQAMTASPLRRLLSFHLAKTELPDTASPAIDADGTTHSTLTRSTSITLSAGTVADVMGAETRLQHQSIDTIDVTLRWRDRFLLLQDTPLPDVLTELNRHTPHRIVIGDPALENLRLGGKIPLGEPEPDFLIHSLEHLLNICTETRGEEIVLKRKC